MLNVERKKTDKIDWVKPLETYITAQYAHERDCLHDHKDAIANLQQLREDVRNIQDKSETARELLHRYHAILTSVETRFPVHENNIRISFPWYDSYKGKKLASFSVHYEKMNVLFNIGALSHQIASSQNKTTADGLKIACQNHQQAAGAFTRLKEELEKHPQSNSFDLTMDSISMLIQLNLAQAQECFYEKAVKDNMNPSIVAKLSAQVVDFYDATATLLHTSALSSSVPRNWVTFVEYKLQLFRANSHYRQSLVHLTTDDYGAQIARLRIAHNCMEDIKKKQLRSLTPELQNDVNTMSNTVQKALQEAEKDNDTIYHSVVVPESKLPAIERKPIVKALPLPESAVMTSEKDPFVRLIPFAITEKLSVYVSRKEALIRSELQSLDEMNNMAIGSLSSMGLPGSIQAIESTGVPSALQEKMLSVKREGGHALVKEQLETLDKMSQEDDRLLKETSRILQQEEQDDNNMRQQYGTRWQRTPSHALTASLTQEASKWAANISHARKSDALLQKEFRDHEAAIIRLSLTQDELLRQLPSSSGPQGNDGGIVLQLKQNLSALDRLMTVDRPVLRTEISGLSAQDDISIRLMACEPGREEDLYNTELQKYDVIKEKIQNSQRDQERLLEEIYNLNMKFQESRNLGGAAQQRGQVLQSLDTAHKVLTELKTHVREGIEFYLNFQEILTQFNQKCKDFVLAREAEKQGLVREMEMASLSMSQNPSSNYGTSYGHPPPASYSQPPVYNQAPAVPPSYQQPVPPVYSQQPPSFQSNPPSYQNNPPPPSYKANPQGPPVYNAPPPSYGAGGSYAPPPNYNRPPPGYSAPPPGYQTAPPQYRK